MTLTSRPNIDYSNLGDFMTLVFELYQKAKNRAEVGSLSKHQLTKVLFCFFNRCLRLVRAYNFNGVLIA